MVQSIISTLKYETCVNLGEYFYIKTDWFDSEDEVQTIIIDQDNTFAKLVSLYPRDFVMYLEQRQDGSLYRTNYPLRKVDNADYYEVVWDQ